MKLPAERIQAKPVRGERAHRASGTREPAASVLALQRTIGNAAVRQLIARTPQEDADKLLKAFEAKFPSAAKYIRGKPAAEKLVLEAATAKVKFGGFAEDGPLKAAWAYTRGDSVYVPKARTDAIVAVSDFLFELNNAIREPQVAANTKAAVEKKVDAKGFARRIVELEVEGMLRMGKIWDEIKAGDKTLDKYDSDFFYAQYKEVKDGKKTAAALRDEVLKWMNGADKSKTNEQFYVDQYPK